MSAKRNGMWDFKSYDEKTWFRFLVIKLIFCGVLYIGFHLLLSNQNYNYEYTKLNQDQMQFINSIYSNPDTPKLQKPDTSKLQGLAKNAQTPANKTTAPPVTGTKSTLAQNNPNKTIKTEPSKSGTGNQALLCNRVMDYLENIFDGKLEHRQADSIRHFLCNSPPQEATGFLNGTRFKVVSYFWLVGPCVYWEVVFWAVFGVLSSLLFNLGVVGSNATTDLGNPQSQFDSSEIFGQVAKILYAPLCTLIVVLGYNFFKDQNIVDISSSKGVIVFAFIGGFYSSRVISLMDRLKDVLMPNSGTTSLPVTNPPTNATGAAIAIVTLQLLLDHGVGPEIVTAIGAQGLNAATVQMKSVNSMTSYTGAHKAGDPAGIFTLTSVLPGNYMISADLPVTMPDKSIMHLSAQLSGPVLSGTAPIELSLKATG